MARQSVYVAHLKISPGPRAVPPSFTKSLFSALSATSAAAAPSAADSSMRGSRRLLRVSAEGKG